MICPHCERYLEDGVAFCIYCGQRLGKYADDASEGTPTINLNDTADAAGQTAAAGSGVSGAHVAAGTAAAAGVAAGATAPVAPASARESAQAASSRPSVSGRGGSSGRLHSDDEIARRMGELDETEGVGRGRKVLAGVIIAGLAAAAIGFGAAYVVPSVTGGGDAGSTSSAVTSSSSDSSSSSSDSKSSSKSSNSSKSSKSSKSSDSANASSSVDTRRGATVERANASDDAESTESTVSTETVEAVPTTGEETTTGVVNTYTPAPSAQGFSNASATATSISPTESGITHGPDLVLDGRPETAWNTNESGINQSITISVDSTATVNGLKIMNGYNKISASGTDLYYANARAKTILIEYATGAFEYTLKDIKGEYQDIPFKDPQPTSWMKITIKSVYPGDLYDDCCISEIDVY